jgi:hypothetical protein
VWGLKFLYSRESGQRVAGRASPDPTSCACFAPPHRVLQRHMWRARLRGLAAACSARLSPPRVQTHDVPNDTPHIYDTRLYCSSPRLLAARRSGRGFSTSPAVRRLGRRFSAGGRHGWVAKKALVACGVARVQAVDCARRRSEERERKKKKFGQAQNCSSVSIEDLLKNN